MNDRSRTRSIRRRKWSSATNDSKSMLVLVFGSNACTPCMAGSLLEIGGVRNETPPETQSTAKNQAESKPSKVLFFNRPGRFLARSRTDEFMKFFRVGYRLLVHFAEAAADLLRPNMKLFH